MRPSETPLTVEINDGVLSIKVGIEVLAWAFEHSDNNNLWSNEIRDFRQGWKVTDQLEFAKDIRNAMLDEEEDGSHLLNIMLDKASENAADGGSMGIDECLDDKSAWSRDFEKEEIFNATHIEG